MSRRVNATECSDEELAAYIKTLDIDRQATYSKFVQFRNLNPGIDAGEFFDIYDGVEPAPWPTEEYLDAEHSGSFEATCFEATHRDTLLDVGVEIEEVEIEEDDSGYSLRWEHGVVGHEPGELNECWDGDRYVPLG